MTPVTSNLDEASTIMGKGCCAPAADRSAESDCCRNSNIEPAAEGTADASRPMATLPGGTFLMGTDYAAGFPADGEGPVRPVMLSPFSIDAFPVTNVDFSAFVDDTGYKTE